MHKAHEQTHFQLPLKEYSNPFSEISTIFFFFHLEEGRFANTKNYVFYYSSLASHLNNIEWFIFLS